MSLRQVIPIDSDWHFKQTGSEDSDYLPVAQFPTQIHLDLLHHNKIPDPNIGKNELDVQWVGEVAWVYKTFFNTPELGDGDKAVLSFEGLDTFATVSVNGHRILETDNMFVPERVDVTSVLAPSGKENKLIIHFDVAATRGEQLVEKYPDHKWVLWNGDSSRLPVRKSQYHWVSQSKHNSLLHLKDNVLTLF